MPHPRFVAVALVLTFAAVIGGAPVAAGGDPPIRLVAAPVAAAAVLDPTPPSTLAPPAPVVTAPTPPAVRPAPAPRVVASSGVHPCGGRLPPCRVMERESHGDPTAWNPNGCYLKPTPQHPVARRGCAGKWQFDSDAWPPGHAGYDRADHAPEALQDDLAAEMWAGGAGCSRWAAC